MTLIATEIDMTKAARNERSSRSDGSTAVHEIEAALDAACAMASGIQDRAALQPLGELPFDPELFAELREALGYREYFVYDPDGQRCVHSRLPDRRLDAHDDKLDTALCYWRAGKNDADDNARRRQFADYLEASGRVVYAVPQFGREVR